MTIALLLARLALTLVFATAAITKLVDRGRSQQMLVDFGAPGALSRPLAILLPLAEIAAAAALLGVGSAWWGAVLALALLVLFSSAIALNLAQGRRPECRCFGRLRSEPIGAGTLVRNAALAALAGFVVVAGRHGAGASITIAGQSPAIAAGILAAAVIALEGWLVLKLLAQNGRVILRLEAVERQLAERAEGAGTALALGAAAPDFSLSDLDGSVHTLPELCAAGKPLLLLFVDPDCGPCHALLPEIVRWHEDHSERFAVALVSRGTPEANRLKIARGTIPVLLQADYEVADAYRVPGTPGAVLVNPDGTVASPPAIADGAIRAIVARALDRRPALAIDPRAENGARNGIAPADSLEEVGARRA